MTTERQWRFNVFLTIGLGAALVVVLVVRPPFPLDEIAVPELVTITVDAGSTGAQLDENGVYWWITSPEATIRIVNNEPEPDTVVVSAKLSNGPCAESRTVSVGDGSLELESAGEVGFVSGEIELQGYERFALPISVDGDPCPPSETEPRPLFVRISDLLVAAP